MTLSIGKVMDHLHPRTREIATEPIEVRIRDVRTPKWIGYSRAKAAIKKLETLIGHPESHRMPNLLIHAPTNNGKTMIVERFLRSYPPNDNPDGDTAEIPVLSVQMPFAPDPKRFYKAILDKIFAAYRHSDNISKLEGQTIQILKACGLKMLVIDELHNMLAGRVDSRRQFLNMLRYIGNELRVPIVGLGIQSALRAIQIDEQLANRFEPFQLPLWSDGEEYRKMLNSIESILPLSKPSRLASNDTAHTIMALSEGTIGEIMSLLREAAVKAIETGYEHIDVPLLRECGYVQPSKRRRHAQSSV